MLDVLRNRRGLVVSAAVVILCIIAFFLATASNWRSFLNHGQQQVTTVASDSAQPGDTTAHLAATTAPTPPVSTSPPSGGTGPAAQSTPPTPAAGEPAPAVKPVDNGTTAAPPAATAAANAPSQPAPSPTTGTAENTPAGSSAGAAGVTAEHRPASSDAVPATGSGSTTAPATGSGGATTPAPSGSTAATEPAKTPDTPAPADKNAAATSTATGDRKPSFDIIRVEPTGESVIAARGAPDSDVELLDGGTVIAHAKTDANGQVAFLPPALKPGEHSLMLSITGPGGTKAVSAQSVAVSIPAEPRTAPMVALIQPNQPAAILSGPVAGSVPTGIPATPPANGSASQSAATKPGEPAEPVAIRSVEAESMGSFYAAGHAPPGSTSRIYLNDAYVATVTAGPGGNWSLRINRGMKPGRYQVRADQVEPSGKVVARAQVPFDYPAQVATSSSGMDAAKKKSEPESGANPSPRESGSAAGAAQGSPLGAAPADPAGRAPVGTQTAQAGGAGSPARPADGRVGAGEPAGPAVAALGGADRTRPASQDHATADLSAAVGTPSGPSKGSPLPPATSPEMSAGSQPSSAQRLDAGGSGATPPADTTTHPVAPPAGLQPPPAGLPQDTGKRTGEAPPKVAGSEAAPESPAQPYRPVADDESPTVVEELVTAKVIHGDSLWRISRQMLGHGIRYTQIYAANTQQIRDPSLIYPGQVFVLPQD